MEKENIDKIYDILDNITITKENKNVVNEIRKNLESTNYMEALDKLEELSKIQKKSKAIASKKTNKKEKKEEVEEKATDEAQNIEKNKNSYKKDDKQVEKYPSKLSNIELEHIYMGLLLSDPKLIIKYHFLFEDCYFEDEEILNLYKSVLFTEGSSYAPEKAKNGFNFSKYSEEVYRLKNKLIRKVSHGTYDMELIYLNLRKLFVLRKSYTSIPIKNIQDKVVEIKDYVLYDKMSIEEVENAVQQVTDTEKFKRGILNKELTSFLEKGENNLRNGLQLPFPILTNVFKGIRKGETMAFAMPSNAGKSRFTTNLAAQVALIHKKKVLIISNEMSEEKMKLCLITTILNNPAIQKLHGQKISKTEGELLEFKFRPDDSEKVEIDENGFIVRQKGEKQEDFVKRLFNESTEFKKTIAVTDWVNKELENSMYFINITDHTNDELKKVIMNYYYKEQIEYIFYDTLKTDTANIGIAEELKRTATILSNLAQNFNLYICSTLQLAESNTLPVNLDVNDLAVSRTVKEVLDTLCLIKQINRDTLQNYEYSLKEVDTTFFELEKFEDPDVRYYACVVDKNRAGAKPTVLFKLNLAYNSWEELGYLRLKQ